MSLLCAIPFASLLFTACEPPAPYASGYVEGEFTLVAPVETAQIRDIAVVRGDRVPPGQVMVEMERRDAEIALAQADANLAQARSQLANLLEGARREEIEVIEATLASAKVQAEEAERSRERMTQLAERGVVTDAQRDDAVTAAQVAQAAVAQVSAELAVARLPARPQAIAQAEAAVAAAEAARDQVSWRLEQRSLSLPETVTVVDVIRQQGEIAGPSAPVLSVLADGAVKLRFYVPEASLSQIAVGDLMAVACDGCDAGLQAKISYISNEPEFTPPELYSVQNRQKLVYLVEARPANGSDLNPGQIVDVALPGAGQ
ncbi:HlyD family secretion protein [Thalassovita mangrovi]|uniref:HlyD family efflux transporter periplasmic adaptor subunit n=1 Tax=Thalassovita mangrovi TaxID=2692236 RepID=A0A6L8LQV5_9RHOB|nr:HlyD family efflux transporter periplasmic adaptor subunit [Thalassovita mangrovi]MYM56940.1 HlyD family efflux transporter periplasmic adaptor subunit [Thalassovita mangrovi]